MDKIRDIGKYIDTVKSHSDFFKRYYFHSLIDLNLTKLDSILRYGILSKNLISKKSVHWTIFSGFNSPMLCIAYLALEER